MDMAEMANSFDPALIELTLLPINYLIEIYKVGGGTDGRRYTGNWGYRILQQGRVLTSGEDLYTGTPKTHREAADIAMETYLAVGMRG